MRLIIAGSRKLSASPSEISQYINTFLYEVKKESMFEKDISITEVISGTASGIDTDGERWARVNNIPVSRFPADWNKYGKQAGYLRNVQMAEHADALLAIWDGKSKGTSHMIKIAKKKGLKIVYILKCNDTSLSQQKSILETYKVLPS